MEWISSLQKAITYMEEHLLEEINYEDVAKHVHISNYEFHRAFSFLTGITANAYIRNRRLSLAGREIVDTDIKITDIAYKYGYDTPESFTKAFTRFHGISPSVARERNAKLVLFNPLVIKLTVDGGKIMEYKIVQTEAKKFIALVRSFKNAENQNREVSNFWEECNTKNLLSTIWKLREDGKHDVYGLCSPAVENSDTFDYGIGIIVDEDTASYDEKEIEKAGFKIWDVNPGTYVVFECKGATGECVANTWSKFYKEFLPQSGYEASDETDYEIYFDNGPEDLFCELWIPVRKS